MGKRWFILTTVLAALSGAGCAEAKSRSDDEFGPDPFAGSGVDMDKPETGAAGAAGNRNSNRPPTLTLIFEEIYVQKCAICHAMMPSDNANGSLGAIRDKFALYRALVGRPAHGPQCVGQGDLVTPYQPQKSLLVQKLRMDPPCGIQMPVGDMLEDSEVRMISQWIAAGAQSN